MPSHVQISAGLIAALLLLGGCSGEATPVTLDVLVTHQADFEGRTVRTAGVVREFAPPHHVWIEDDALNRVELTPPEPASEYVGTEVEVTGRFTFDPDAGRRIHVEAIRPQAHHNAD